MNKFKYWLNTRILFKVTKFKGPKVGGKTSSDVFDVKVRSGDDDMTDLGENQIEVIEKLRITY